SLEGGKMNRPGKLSHFDRSGRAHMVDVGDKPETHRVARAGGTIRMACPTLKLILAGDARKGDVLGVARVAAIQAAKRTAELIPTSDASPYAAFACTVLPSPYKNSPRPWCAIPLSGCSSTARISWRSARS